MPPQQHSPPPNDEDALRAFLDAYRRPLFAVLRRLLQNEDDAEDALADGIWKVWQARQSFRGECSWKNWVFRIVRNTGLDLLEKRAPQERNRVAWDDAEREAEGSTTAAPQCALVDNVVRGEEAAQVRAALARLPDEYRIAVALHYLENKSYREIEEITGVPQTTLKPRLSRALKMLRHELAELTQDTQDNEHRQPATAASRRPRRQPLL